MLLNEGEREVLAVALPRAREKHRELAAVERCLHVVDGHVLEFLECGERRVHPTDVRALALLQPRLQLPRVVGAHHAIGELVRLLIHLAPLDREPRSVRVGEIALTYEVSSEAVAAALAALDGEPDAERRALAEVVSPRGEEVRYDHRQVDHHRDDVDEDDDQLNYG